LFHDSNTANPGTPGTPPELKPDNGGDNGGDGPGTTTPAVKIAQLQLTSPVSGSAYSKEGQKPVLTGLKVRVIYDSSTGKDPEELTVSEHPELFGTAPAVLGEEQLNIASGGHIRLAAPTWISVFPKDDQSRSISVAIPGVQALVVSGDRLETNSYVRGTTNLMTDGAIAIGLKKSVDYSFSDIDFTGVTIYEDEFKEPPVVKGNAIKVKYHGLYTTITGTQLEDDAGVVSGGALASDLKREQKAAPSSDWETIALGPEHIFYDYHTDFLTAAYGSTKPYLEYGLDLVNKEVAFLISRGKGGSHGGTTGTNRSIFIIVPFTETTFHYVRDIEVSKLTYTTKDADDKPWPEFLIQSDLLALDKAGWEKMLIESKIELKVWYDDYSTFKTRPVEYFERAQKLGGAGVMNYNHTPPIRIPTPNVSNADEDNFGYVSIAYWTSLPTMTPNRDPITVGDFPNVHVIKLPIATYTEQANFRLRKNAIQESDVHDDKLKFIADNPTNIPSGQRITDAMLEALRNSYEFVGNFSLENQVVVKEIIPKGEWQASWFSAMTTNEIDENFEVNVNVRNASENYTMFNGAEATFYVRLYPREYDTQ
jgi:hypothetical protein